MMLPTAQSPQRSSQVQDIKWLIIKPRTARRTADAVIMSLSLSSSYHCDRSSRSRSDITHKLTARISAVYRLYRVWVYGDGAVFSFALTRNSAPGYRCPFLIEYQLFMWPPTPLHSGGDPFPFVCVNFEETRLVWRYADFLFGKRFNFFR